MRAIVVDGVLLLWETGRKEGESLGGCDVSSLLCMDMVGVLGLGQGGISLPLKVVVGPLAVRGSLLCSPDPGAGAPCPPREQAWVQQERAHSLQPAASEEGRGRKLGWGRGLAFPRLRKGLRSLILTTSKWGGRVDG